MEQTLRTRIGAALTFYQQRHGRSQSVEEWVAWFTSSIEKMSDAELRESLADGEASVALSEGITALQKAELLRRVNERVKDL